MPHRCPNKRACPNKYGRLGHTDYHEHTFANFQFRSGKLISITSKEPHEWHHLIHLVPHFIFVQVTFNPFPLLPYSSAMLCLLALKPKNLVFNKWDCYLFDRARLWDLYCIYSERQCMYSVHCTLYNVLFIQCIVYPEGPVRWER